MKKLNLSKEALQVLNPETMDPASGGQVRSYPTLSYIPGSCNPTNTPTCVTCQTCANQTCKATACGTCAEWICSL